MIIAGKEIARTIQKELKEKVASFSKKPGLAMILVGDHPPSHAYVNVKKKACLDVGIESKIVQLNERVAEYELLSTIELLNLDQTIDGILLQSPLPSHLISERAYTAIDPDKDVDGFHPLNMGKLFLGYPGGFVPCTPLGIVELLKRSHLPIQGKHAVIVGRSNIVGKPLAALLLQEHATVTIVHSKTKDLPQLTKSGDIVVAALGKPGFIKAEMVKDGAVVIDVGINRIDDKLVGDVDFEHVAPKCAAITPVPGGVGPMTVAMLLHNTVLSFERRCAG